MCRYLGKRLAGMLIGRFGLSSIADSSSNSGIAPIELVVLTAVIGELIELLRHMYVAKN
jgi:hypothetical protein